ncbi:MAG: triose-phosphate isomerase [Actinomycetota bacterium]|nr:triose-phosphate isomerase [Actinomycetota bacterium]
MAAPQDRALYVGVSTKMYLGYAASLEWLDLVAGEIRTRPMITPSGPVRVFIVPSFPVLESARRIFAGLPVILGAQNCGWSDGPFTGEVGAGMLAEMGVGLVELGHAERRRHFGEHDDVVARKVRAAAVAGLAPLLCIGEREAGTPAEAAAFCLSQVCAAIGGGADIPNTILAYEPVWAIGAPEPAPAGYVNDVVAQLRAALGPGIPVIYGGSAGPGLLPRLTEVDGLFLGRFAHQPANLGLVLDEALAVRMPVAG